MITLDIALHVVQIQAYINRNAFQIVHKIQLVQVQEPFQDAILSKVFVWNVKQTVTVL